MPLFKLPTIKTLILCAIVSCIVGNLVWLLYFPSKSFETPCPMVIAPETAEPWAGKNGISVGKGFNCSAIYQGHDAPLPVPSSTKWCRRRDVISDADYVLRAANCDSFVRNRGYHSHHVTAEERDFPVAFSILMHTDVERTERLLRAIYRPHNLYCIHVDTKSPASIHAAMAAIARCLPNVMIASRQIQVHWAEFSLLEAEIICLDDLWKNETWKYYINLAGSEFPLRTNLELVKILKAYNGGNEIDGSLNRRPVEWTKYSWRREYWRTNTLKSPPPHGFHVAKGSTHVVASRRFVDYALHDPKALDLLQWMRDVRCPEEHFFQTLNNNPHMGVPGAYTGDPDQRDGFYVRYKQWYAPDAVCHGKWVNFICVLSARDLHKAVVSRHMFLNKLDLGMDPIGYQCLEQWLHKRTTAGVNPDFDLEFYKSRKLVNHHV